MSSIETNPAFAPILAPPEPVRATVYETPAPEPPSHEVTPTLELSLGARRRAAMAEELAALRKSFESGAQPLPSPDRQTIKPDRQSLERGPHNAQQEGTATEPRTAAGEALSEDEQQALQQLQARQREVVAHEQAHMAAASGLATGSPSYEYKNGPDGKRYVSGGEVNIQLKKGRTPAETVRNARQVQQAATAPANPSAQDRRVAAKAAAMEQRASKELAAKDESTQGRTPAESGGGTG